MLAKRLVGLLGLAGFQKGGTGPSKQIVRRLPRKQTSIGSTPKGRESRSRANPVLDSLFCGQREERSRAYSRLRLPRGIRLFELRSWSSSVEPLLGEGVDHEESLSPSRPNDAAAIFRGFRVATRSFVANVAVHDFEYVEVHWCLSTTIITLCYWSSTLR